MSTIKEYTVIACNGHHTLAQEVQKSIQERGWQPIGGLSSFSRVINIETGQTEAIYSQAMVKYDEAKGGSNYTLG